MFFSLQAPAELNESICWGEKKLLDKDKLELKKGNQI